MNRNTRKSALKWGTVGGAIMLLIGFFDLLVDVLSGAKVQDTSTAYDNTVMWLRDHPLIENTALSMSFRQNL